MRIISRSHQETVAIGRRVGLGLKKGDVVCMYGELGAGKTTMIRGIAAGFGIDERDVTSASFTIIAEYPGAVPFYHVDLYRLDDLRAIEETGLQEYLAGEGVCVIEWAGKAKGLVDCGVTVRMEFSDNGEGEDVRIISIDGLEV